MNCFRYGIQNESKCISVASKVYQKSFCENNKKNYMIYFKLRSVTIIFSNWSFT
jgi:hypothetical protein